MNIHFEWAWMNHEDPAELLRQLVVVTKIIEGSWNPSRAPCDHQVKDQVAQDKQ